MEFLRLFVYKTTDTCHYTVDDFESQAKMFGIDLVGTKTPALKLGARSHWHTLLKHPLEHATSLCHKTWSFPTN